MLTVSGQNIVLPATLVLGFGALIGMALRAATRCGAGLVAALAGRPALHQYALGLAAAVTLALNRRASGEPGWQLSSTRCGDARY